MLLGLFDFRFSRSAGLFAAQIFLKFTNHCSSVTKFFVNHFFIGKSIKCLKSVESSLSVDADKLETYFFMEEGSKGA